jgi:S1-C subfamily serine protease
LDSSGRLIGVNTAIYSPSGSSAGIGFAIPIDEVNQVVAQLIRNGKVVRPGLGIVIWPDVQTHQAGLQGVLIKELRPGSPAEKAGLQGTRREGSQTKLGDLIVAIGGEPITRAKDLFRALDGHKPGDQVTVTVERDGDRVDVPVTLGTVE